ncbi:MAG: hypothetical protein KatS3mg051_2079 [Anaerolineae bacterium]|nr:MAG: hypothetical protein KatS3mg051_2079 [Anaerolineae bacterium]
MTEAPIHIGVDPGLQHTGLALWDGERLYGLRTTEAGRVLAYILREHPPETCVVHVEDPGLNRRLWYDNKGTGRQSGRRALHVARSVGRNEGAARVIIQTLQQMGYTVHRRRPTRGGGTKLPADAFARLTEYEDRCSQHARDAAMLVFGLQHNRDA